MQMIMLGIGIVLGIALGCSISVAIVMRDIKISNDLGDSRASFSDFCEESKPKLIDFSDKVPGEFYISALLTARAAQNGKLKKQQGSVQK